MRGRGVCQYLLRHSGLAMSALFQEYPLPLALSRPVRPDRPIRLGRLAGSSADQITAIKRLAIIVAMQTHQSDPQNNFA